MQTCSHVWVWVLARLYRAIYTHSLGSFPAHTWICTYVRSTMYDRFGTFVSVDLIDWTLTHALPRQQVWARTLFWAFHFHWDKRVRPSVRPSYIPPGLTIYIVSASLYTQACGRKTVAQSKCPTKEFYIKSTGGNPASMCMRMGPGCAQEAKHVMRAVIYIVV